MDLFEQRRERLLRANAPLADRLRPRTLDEFVGQDHIIGPGRLLRRAIQIDQLSSVIFYGPPGTGKTTLARIIANTTRAQFISINAVLAGVKDIREAIDNANQALSLHGKRTILFVDEVHRFNKAQQDALLPHVENGIIILIGATTENPYFEVNKALVSRSRIFQLKSLTEDDLVKVARMALADTERGFGNRPTAIDGDAILHLVQTANGDARSVLNALELAVETTAPGSDGVIRIDRSVAEESIQRRAVLYDKDGDAHYDTISAFIKSVRGSDPDAALYWMAKMVYAGEDPRFIFRRMVILACEDVGLADPQALGVVMSAAQAFDFVGMPEGRYHLAHACLYLATAPKSNSSMAFFDALNLVTKEASDDVPDPLRDASRDGDGFGHGEGYLYPHAYRDHWVAQQYLPDALMGKMFFQPSDRGYEKSIKERVTRMREAQLAAMVEPDAASVWEAKEPAAQSEATAQWAKRTAGSSGEMLAAMRDRVLDMAGINRESLVLDLDTRTGLLSFQAARTASNGGVWSLAHDDKSFATLTKMAESLDQLERPQVLRCTWEDFHEVLSSSAGAGVRFDTIVGINVLGKCADRTALVTRLAPFLTDNGTLAIAEQVPSLGQRVSELCDLSLLAEERRSAFVETEAALFADAANPMVNWDDRTLAANLGQVDGISAQVTIDTQTPQRRLTGEDIEHWFRDSAAGEPASLGTRLRQRLDAEGIEALRRFLHSRLANRNHRWKTVVCWVKIVRSAVGEARIEK
jgi:putative ATPase